VGMRRICDGPPGQFCYVRRVTVPGAYTVEVCAHSAARGTSSEPDLSNRLVGVTVAGERTCVRETFRHPERATVEVRFGR
jgi:hypothetical protein